MKGMFKIIPAALLTAVCTVALTACGGPSPEEAATAAVTETLDAYKNREGEMWEKFLEDAEASNVALDDYGVTTEEVIDVFLDGFDYEINEATADEDSATVDVTITAKKMSSIAEEEVEKQLGELLSDPSVYSLPEEELKKEVADVMFSIIETAPLEDTDVEIECTKDGDTWVIDEDSFGDQLEEAMFG